MRAWLEVHVERSALSCGARPRGYRLGVRVAEARVKSLADDVTFRDADIAPTIGFGAVCAPTLG